MTTTDSTNLSDGLCPNSTSGDLAASSAPSASSSLSRNAVNRGFSDLHIYTWLALVSSNALLRTLLLHPLNLAVARKRVTRDENTPSVFSIMRSAYRGEVRGSDGIGRRSGGLRDLYRGLGAAMIANLVGELAYLHTMELTKETLDNTCSEDNGASRERSRDFTTNSYSAAIGGMAGELASLLIVTPMVVVCNRQMTAGFGMTSGNRYSSLRDTLVEVCNLYRPPGGVSRWCRVQCRFRGLYAGLLPGILGLPASGVWWALYGRAKACLYTCAEPTLTQWERESITGERQATPSKYHRIFSSTDNVALNALAGMIASCITALIFNPCEVVHTRMQALPARCSSLKAANGNSIRKVVKDLIVTEGWRALFKGTTANVSASVLSGLVFSPLFELTKLGSDREFLNQL